MADTFEIVAVTPTQVLDAANRPKDVLTATAITLPHNVMFEVTVDKVPGWKDALAAAAKAEAAELESAFTL